MFIVPVLTALVSQLYWASLLLIGWALLSVIYSTGRLDLSNFWRKVPLFGLLAIFFLAGSVWIGLWTITGYLLGAPSYWLAVGYIIGLLTSVIVLKKRMTRNSTDILNGKLRNFRLNFQSIAFIFLIVVIVIDYILSIHSGSAISGDPYIHMSKIHHIATDGLTLTDAYFGSVPETRHTITIIHSIIAIPVIFGMKTLDSWLMALAPLKLMIWSAIFLLSFTTLKLIRFSKREAYSMAAFFTIITISLMNSFYFTKPSMAVILWVLLFTIGLLLLYIKKNPYLLLASSLMVSMTHPVISVALLLLVCLIYAITLIVGRNFIDRQKHIVFFITAGLLIWMPVYSFLLPSQMTDAAVNYGKDTYQYISVLGMDSFKPSLKQYLNANVDDGILLALALMGLMYLFFSIRNRSLLIIYGAYVIFIPLTLYFPPTFSLLQIVLPDWAIKRFEDVNIPGSIFVGLGLVVISKIASQLIFKKKDLMIPAMLIFSMGLLIYANPFRPENRLYPAGYNPEQYGQWTLYEHMNQIDNLLGGVEGYNLILAPIYFQNYQIPAVSPNNVLAIAESNATPAADSKQRQICYGKLISELDLNLMNEVGVDYVLAPKGSELNERLASGTSFHLIKQSKYDNLYEIEYGSSRGTKSDICNFNE